MSESKQSPDNQERIAFKLLRAQILAAYQTLAGAPRAGSTDHALNIFMQAIHNGTRQGRLIDAPLPSVRTAGFYDDDGWAETTWYASTPKQVTDGTAVYNLTAGSLGINKAGEKYGHVELSDPSGALEPVEAFFGDAEGEGETETELPLQTSMQRMADAIAQAIDRQPLAYAEQITHLVTAVTHPPSQPPAPDQAVAPQYIDAQTIPQFF